MGRKPTSNVHTTEQIKQNLQSTANTHRVELQLIQTTILLQKAATLSATLSEPRFDQSRQNEIRNKWTQLLIYRLSTPMIIPGETVTIQHF